MPRRTAADDRAHPRSSGVSPRANLANAMIAEIGDIERPAGCRCTSRKVEPCRYARTVGMCAGRTTTGYDRADSRRGCVNGTQGMLGEIGNVERITALRDRKRQSKRRRGADAVSTGRASSAAARECGNVPCLRIRRRRGRLRRRLFRVRRGRCRRSSVGGSRTAARWICIASSWRRAGDEQQRYREYGEQRSGEP